MPSIEVTQNATSTGFVVSSAEANAEATAAAFAAEFARTDEERSRASEAMRFVLSLVARSMTEATADTVLKDDALQLELGNDRTISEERATALLELRAEFVDVKELAGSVLGRSAVVELGLDGETPEGAPELVRTATQAANAFEKTPERPGKRGLVIRASDYAPALRARTQRLERAIAASTADLRENQARRADRDEALRKSQRRFLRGARVIEALLRVAELDALADRVRPSTRRPGNTVENDGDGPAAPQPAA